MARNWKKAHDAERDARLKLATECYELKDELERSHAERYRITEVRVGLESRLSKALTLALGAAENLEAQGKSASATALRNAVDVLNPSVSQ